ncbi:hypothetical protein F975_00430 [Acinetobacter sp. ANC 3789]|uniref:hypothetical protein n=1 Tax=Acinetobacter sp. ANC 3789 TaxID=1217714 RepID=UPI0002CF06A4|nr:hypothetical protein [Acinetobacter sp. ANC 3789]ENU81815.1 hypothetical protein F975_00430 [Acinetobacter sp. ANC 3789]
MSNIRLKKALLLCGISSLCSSVFALPLSSDDACKAANVRDFSQMFSCGTVEGSLRLASYSTHNAYFLDQIGIGRSEDTTTAGGYVNYKTARYNGFQAVVGIEGQNRLSHGSHSVSELSDGTFGIGEAYLNWKQDKFSVTVGNQRLDLPFMGDYSDYRVQPWLYQGVDMKYGDADNFVRVTYINKYKSYGDDNFTHRDRYNDDSTLDTHLDHVTSFGLGKKFNLNDKYLKTQAWVESYEDSFNLYYGEANLGFTKVKWNPEVSVQAAYANDIGDAQFGKVDSTSLGAQLKLKPTDKLTWRIGYDHVFKKNNAWGLGSLPTPYAHNTSSDPYFAQPFFTSTQDLGPGDFYTTELSSPFGQNAFVGTRLSYVAVNDSYKKLSSLNNDMYEVMFYGFYNFTGSLKGLSLSEFVGFQKLQGDANLFLQNRFGITYNF